MKTRFWGLFLAVMLLAPSMTRVLIPMGPYRAEASIFALAEDLPEAVVDSKMTPPPPSEPAPEDIAAPEPPEHPTVTDDPPALPPDPTPEAEEAGDESPEHEEAASPETDTTQDASFSPAFARGWVEIGQDAPLYKGPGASAFATVSKGVGYALSRKNPGGSADCLATAFAAGGEAQIAYVAAKNLRPMSGEEINAYLSLCAQSSGALPYEGDPDLPLLPLVMSPWPPSEEPTEEPPAEEPDGSPMEEGAPGPIAELPAQEDAPSDLTLASRESFIDGVVSLVNIERQKFGLSKLSAGYGALNAAAGIRAEELPRHFSHTRPNGTSWLSALSENGIYFASAGENIAAGYSTPAAVVTGWMNSPGHRANILNGNFNYLGVGYAYSASTTYKHYWVQMFTATAPQLRPSPMLIRPGQKSSLTFFPSHPYAAESSTWRSSNPAVATVDGNGRVTGVSTGTATITAVITSYYNHSVICAVTVDPNAPLTPIEEFISRLYRNVMARPPDAAGLDFWNESLLAGSRTGADVCAFFYTCAEFTALSKTMTDEAFVTNLYNNCMGRPPDAAGMAYWKSTLNAGATRISVMAWFVTSPEFASICQRYGIVRGSYNPPDYRDKNMNVTMFVTRLYRLFLSRQPEAGGLEHWCRQLLTNRNTGSETARDFVYSDEFQNRPLTDARYVEIMYNGLMGRPSDAAGLTFWLGQISLKGRPVVFNGFIASPEWKSIMASYGIK